MRNIFLFLRRYFTFFTFVLLQIVALWMLFKYNRYHRAAFLGVANEFTGKVNTQADKLNDYFRQGDENIRLHRVNDSLLNLLRSNFDSTNVTQQLVTDSLKQDSTYKIRRYLWRDAKVVYNTTNAEQNYLQLNRGSNHGVKDNMAILSSDLGVVGIVVNVSPNFSQVMSLLHVKNTVSAAHKNSGSIGKVEWDARDPRELLLRGIPRDAQLKAGDSVLTSRYSDNFPPNYLIGTIKTINSDPATGFYILKIKPAVNFSTIQQVFIVENLQRDEQMELMKETEKKMEQPKNNQR
jgi:rod shape-determining protein MreC